MIKSDEKLILLTNDDGIQSPGLRAAAEALSALGWVTVVAPLEQWSGAGRSLLSHTGGVIQAQKQQIGGDHWEVFAVNGTPAQAVQHGLLEMVERKPDLVVSGINYGENVGSGITISGTVGAALEAASFGIPALAVSLETPPHYHHSYSDDIDFSVAAHFARFFAALLLKTPLPPDVDMIKVDVPASARRDTQWHVTSVSRHKYYLPIKPERQNFSELAKIGYDRKLDATIEPGSDVDVLVNYKLVSVSPLSLDLTSRIDLSAWEQTLKGANHE
jgi:5'-nucleotidase